MSQHYDFSTKPTSGQFAKDGCWEEAWIFACAELPDEARVCAYAQGRTELAFEVFHGEAFFGLRFEGEPDAVEAFALKCVQALRLAGHGRSVVTSLQTALHLDNLGVDLAFAEVGAVNAWRSVGAFLIEQPGTAAQHFDSLWAALASAPVAKDVRHRKAVELAYRTPLPHWFGIPVGDDEAPYRISPARLLAALSGAGAGADFNRPIR